MSEANDYYSPDQDHRVCRRTDNIRTNYLSFLSQCCQQLVLCIGQLCFCSPQSRYWSLGDDLYCSEQRPIGFKPDIVI